MSQLPAKVTDALLDGAPLEWDDPSTTISVEDRAAVSELAEIFAAFRSLSAERPSTDPVASGTWGPLLVQEEIGRGAHSVVYRAIDRRLDRSVALKLLTGVVDLPADAASTLTAQVVEEGRLAARVRHPNVVVVFGADVVANTPGVWMELVEGQHLSADLAARGPSSWQEAALVGSQICGALAALHQAGLLHRDIKPQNIMRERGGRTVLMDLGAGVDLTDAGPARGPAGTPLYMAPELFDAGTPSVSTEVYAMGALLYFLTTGGHPVTGRDLGELRFAHANGLRRLLSEERPGLDDAFVAVVERALSRDPAARQRSAGELQQALTACLARRTVAVWSWRRVWVPSLILAVLTTGIAAGILLAPRHAARPNMAANEAAADPARRPAAIFAPEQLDAAAAFEDLAAADLASGRADRAIDRYDAARRIYVAGRGPDTPAAAETLVMSGWAHFVARRYKDARDAYELALVKLVQELGPNHPLVIAALLALAVDEQHDHRPDAAADALARAILAERRLFGLDRARTNGDDAAPLPRSVGELARILATARLDVDSDGDGLSDAVEAMLGTSPTSATSQPGMPDAEGDADHDGWPDGLEYGFSVDPTGALALMGTHDPSDLGYRTSRPAVGTASADGTAWTIHAPQQSHYYRRFTSTQIERAATTGFRLTAVAKAIVGGAFVVADLGSTLGRFDIHMQPGDPPSMRIQTSVVPLEGPQFALPSDRWSVLQLIFDPRTKTSTLYIDGRRRAEKLTSHQQFIEGYGFMVGADNDFGHAPAAEGVFRVAMIEIH